VLAGGRGVCVRVCVWGGRGAEQVGLGARAREIKMETYFVGIIDARIAGAEKLGKL
jgi:hypothetical protein